MKLEKSEILKALESITVAGEGKNMVESGAVKNVVTFADEVIVDVTIANPALQARKKTEAEIKKVIIENVEASAQVKVNIKVEAPTAATNEIKGKAIPGRHWMHSS